MSDTPDRPNLDSPPLRRCAELLGIPLAGVEFPGGRRRVFSDGLGLGCPELPLARIEALYTVPRPRFVKWDARPGNAMVGEGGAVAWFDFADCCCRRRLDDLGWLLGDEFTPDLPEAEERLLARHLPAFADDLDPAAARLYLRVFGVFHSLCRLGLILDDAFEHGWRDWARCLEGDK